MPLKKIVRESGYSCRYEIAQENIHTPQGLEKVLECLEQMVADVKRHLTAPDMKAEISEIIVEDIVGDYAYKARKYVAVRKIARLYNDVVGKLSDDEYNGYISKRINRYEPDYSYHNPWDEENIMTYLALAQSDNLADRLEGMLDNLVGIHKAISEGKSRLCFLAEEDTVLFGEPMLASMAMANRRFIPYYTECLRYWDMESEVYQNDEIFRIVKKYGFIKPVEDLLVVRIVENPGQEGYEILNVLYPLIKDYYGDFARTPFFDRLIKTAHEKRLEYYNEMKSRGLGPDNINVRSCVEDLDLVDMSEDSALREEIRRRCAMLDAQTGIQ
jgi:hypothetical protein